jgi:hypothetical protein
MDMDSGMNNVVNEEIERVSDSGRERKRGEGKGRRQRNEEGGKEVMDRRTEVFLKHEQDERRHKEVTGFHCNCGQ